MREEKYETVYITKYVGRIFKVRARQLITGGPLSGWWFRLSPTDSREVYASEKHVFGTFEAAQADAKKKLAKKKAALKAQLKKLGTGPELVDRTVKS